MQREAYTDRERNIDKARDKHRDLEIEMQTDRDRERDRNRDRDMDRHSNEMHRQTHRHSNALHRQCKAMQDSLPDCSTAIAAAHTGANGKMISKRMAAAVQWLPHATHQIPYTIKYVVYSRSPAPGGFML